MFLLHKKQIPYLVPPEYIMIFGNPDFTLPDILGLSELKFLNHLEIIPLILHYTQWAKEDILFQLKYMIPNNLSLVST